MQRNGLIFKLTTINIWWLQIWAMVSGPRNLEFIDGIVENVYSSVSKQFGRVALRVGSFSQSNSLIERSGTTSWLLLIQVKWPRCSFCAVFDVDYFSLSLTLHTPSLRYDWLTFLWSVCWLLTSAPNPSFHGGTMVKVSKRTTMSRLRQTRIRQILVVLLRLNNRVQITKYAHFQ